MSCLTSIENNIGFYLPVKMVRGDVGRALILAAELFNGAKLCEIILRNGVRAGVRSLSTLFSNRKEQYHRL